MKLIKTEQKKLFLNKFNQLNKNSIVVLLENIRSAYNIGSLFRIADAFQVNKLFLCGISAIPPHRGIQKTALGATESVNWEYCTSISQLIKELKKKYLIIAVEQVLNYSKSLNLYSIQKNSSYALIFGNEINGVSKETLSLIDDCIEVPQSGKKRSLNISVCAGIVIWEFYKIFNEN